MVTRPLITVVDDDESVRESLPDLLKEFGFEGDDDQIVPIDDSARLSAKTVKNATLNVYPGAPHGMCSTHKDQVNADLLAFIKVEKSAAARFD